MPRSIDLFIASQDALQTVAAAVSETEHVRVAPGDGESWIVEDGDVRVVLRRHDLAGDHDVPLGRYPYVATAEVPDTVRPQDSPPAALLRRVAQQLEREPSVVALLVLDLQYRAAGGATEPPEVHA
jgi:hypothetical protein